MTEFELGCQVALSHTFLSSAVSHELVSAFGSAQAVWEAPAQMLQTQLKPKQSEKLAYAQKTLNPMQLLDLYQKHGVQIISLRHPQYWPLLCQIHHPPFLLYVRGNSAVSAEKTLGIVGTRRFTHYGKQSTEKAVEAVADLNPCIVSGLAAGIDTVAHQAALKHNLPTIAVFGTGIDHIFPRQNTRLAQQIIEAGGALVSEYPIGFPGDKYTFPQRNRIIAGLSQGVLVVEGNQKSGALITARFALEENRQVFAVPGNIFNATSEGPNHLIQEGAIPVLTGHEIPPALNWQVTGILPSHRSTSISADLQARLQTLSTPEKAIFDMIGSEPVLLDDLQARQKNLSIMELNTMLTMLELQGLVTALPGSRFTRN